MNATDETSGTAGTNDARREDIQLGPLLRDLARRFFSGNPFFLASAGILLYGLNRLSTDPHLAGAESAQLTFNFATLFFYEVLLVVTAILLARRTIWYDTLLLVGLENLFVLIPFSLVSRAVLVDQRLADEMCVAATLFALGKFWALRRYIPGLYLPKRLLMFGGVFLAANLAAALSFHRIGYHGRLASEWLMAGWVIILPVLVALGNFLPTAATPDNKLTKRTWLPYALMGLWLVVSIFHLAGVGYVYGFNWQNALIAPTLCVLAWTIYFQVPRLVPAVSTSLRRGLLLSPIVASLVAIQDERIFLALNAINAVCFAYLWLTGVDRKFVLTLGLVSFAAGLSSLPVTWLGEMPDFSRPEWTLGCFTACLLGMIIASRDPRWGLVGGLAWLGIGTTFVRHLDISGNWAVQAGLIFVLCHSLRWRDTEHSGARELRVFICIAWILDSVFWAQAGGDALIGGCAFGLTVCVMQGLHWLAIREWKSRIVGISAMVVIATAPLTQLAQKLKSTSPGYVAVIGSFVLFALGTIAAFTRPRWDKNR